MDKACGGITFVGTALILVWAYQHFMRSAIRAYRVSAALAAVVLLGLYPFTAHGQAASSKRVAIVRIDEETSTIRTIKGVTKVLQQQGVGITFREVLLTGAMATDARIMDSLKYFDPHLLITVGSFATGYTARQFPDKPIVFATVMNPEASGFVASMARPGGNITGAALDIPPDIQFTYIKKVIGNLKTLGVLYSRETENVIRQAEIAARQLGIRLAAIRIDSERQIPQALDSLCAISDALWSVADQTIFTPQSTPHIILQTLRHRIPLMGFSRTVVEAGGLFTLDFDFKDIGRQAGEIAVHVLTGQSPAEIPVTTPGAGILYFKYNEKTAQQLNLKIPEELLAVAKEVLR